jgi:hypothetical protein
MRFLRFGTAGLVAMALSASAATAQHAVHIEGDTITMRGCVTAATADLQMPFETLMWSRGGILTAGAMTADMPARASAEELASRVLYWIDDDALKDHVGRMVEVKGDLEDVESGELEIERDGDFTEIRLELDGREDTIRVPTSWLEPRSVTRASRTDDPDDDIDIDIATRKVDVNDVKVLGPCR